LVLKSTLEEKKMAHRNRKVHEEMVQGILLDDPAFLKEIVERVLQGLLEAEMTEHIGAAPYERTQDRKGQRNGYKPRTLRTRVGTLNLAVPQDREGAFSTRLFARYQRNEKALCLALMQMYVEGVSTRKVKEVTEELCGTSFSKSLVSQLASSLDSELEAWRNRRLEAEAYPYLYVDARYEKVRVDGRVVNQGVLLVSAVRDDGMREILGVEVADTESEATYHELFRSLKRRGLSGVELVVSDDHEGLKSALARHFQGASWQRCLLSTTRATSSGWWATPGARTSQKACAGCSPLGVGRWLCSSLPSWRPGGAGATLRSQSISKNTSRSASHAWPSPRAIGGASARPMAWRD
jgi:putative transposase